MRIYTNGRGSLSAAGRNSAAAWETYVAGRRTWEIEETTGLPVYRATDLPDQPQVKAFTERGEVDRATELALYAADEAVRDAGWLDKDFSILVGCSRGPTESWEMGFDQFRELGRVGARTSPQTTLGGIGFALADYFETSALASGLSVTCSSGLHALLHGVALLRSGMAERVLVGGAEAPLTEFTLRQMEALRITAPVPEGEEHACRPFSHPRSGMALGEGAAFFALSLEPGKLELSGLAFARESAGSATGITSDGMALQHTMRGCLDEAGSPDFIVAHAPGTKRGDAAELAALHGVFGQDSRAPGVTSFKWATGHTFGASGPLALDAALSMLEQQRWLGLPYGNEDKGARTLVRGMVNATGFGGNAVSVGIKLNQPS